MQLIAMSIGMLVNKEVTSKDKYMIFGNMYYLIRKNHESLLLTKFRKIKKIRFNFFKSAISTTTISLTDYISAVFLAFLSFQKSKKMLNAQLKFHTFTCNVHLKFHLFHLFSSSSIVYTKFFNRTQF